MIVILTGAGISAESGLPTFRDKDGLWEGHRVEEVAYRLGFGSDQDSLLTTSVLHPGNGCLWDLECGFRHPNRTGNPLQVSGGRIASGSHFAASGPDGQLLFPLGAWSGADPGPAIRRGKWGL